MASTKSQGSSNNGRDSKGQRLGVKAYGGELITAGSIIIRQRGTKVYPGRNTKMASDNTIFSLVDGHVKFEWKAKGRKHVTVIPAVAA